MKEIDAEHGDTVIADSDPDRSQPRGDEPGRPSPRRLMGSLTIKLSELPNFA